MDPPRPWTLATHPHTPKDHPPWPCTVAVHRGRRSASTAPPAPNHVQTGMDIGHLPMDRSTHPWTLKRGQYPGPSGLPSAPRPMNLPIYTSRGAWILAHDDYVHRHIHARIHWPISMPLWPTSSGYILVYMYIYWCVYIYWCIYI